jgi:hypothetical protein
LSITFEEAAAAHRAGDFETAERGYLANLSTRNAMFNLGLLYREHSRFDEAEQAFRLIHEQYPDYAPAARALGVCRLSLRRYAEAWPLYEWRGLVSPTPPPATDLPEWREGDPAGRRIVCVAEQGLGDQLMFGRYLAILRERGAEPVVACDPQTIARVFECGGFETTPYLRAGAALAARTGEAWVFLNSLPARLGLSAPPAPAYLAGAVAMTSGGGIGVMTAGNPAHYNDANRSLPPDAATALRMLGRDLAPAATGARDLLETAEIVAGLDLVVTVDTAIAHLAGAMGKPCWVLLPWLGLDWRWNDGQRSDWYPQARLFRCGPARAWTAAVAQAREALGV